MLNKKIVYFTVLALVIFAWFIPDINPITSLATAPVATASVVNDPASLGLKIENLSPGGKCNLEFINDSPMNGNIYEMNKDTALKLIGWAIDDQKLRLPQQVVIRIVDTNNAQFFASAQVGLPRTDVRDYLKLPEELKNSGFQLLANPHGLLPGEYKISIVLPFEDRTYSCDNGRTIKIH